MKRNPTKFTHCQRCNKPLGVGGDGWAVPSRKDQAAPGSSGEAVPMGTAVVPVGLPVVGNQPVTPVAVPVGPMGVNVTVQLEDTRPEQCRRRRFGKLALCLPRALVLCFGAVCCCCFCCDDVEAGDE